MKKFVATLVVMVSSCTPPALYAQVPPAATKNLPILAQHIRSKWPQYKFPHFIAAQIEQETCISLKSSKCWTSRAELKTKREYGFSFGQFTIAYNADGSERFNAFEDVKKLDRDLRGWDFKDRYDENYGLMAVVVRDRSEHGYVTGAATELDQAAFAFSAYNGGRGSVLKDRRFCKTQPGCDPNRWFGNVEKYSYKPRTVTKGYGKSFFEINREYVSNILRVRSVKYADLFPK